MQIPMIEWKKQLYKKLGKPSPYQIIEVAWFVILCMHENGPLIFEDKNLVSDEISTCKIKAS